MNISYIYTHSYIFTWIHTHIYIYIYIYYTYTYIYMDSGASSRAVELTKVLNSHPLRRVGLVLDQWRIDYTQIYTRIYIYISTIHTVIYIYIYTICKCICTHTHMCLDVLYISLEIVNLVIALFAYVCCCTLEILYFNHEKCPSNMIKHEHEKYVVYVCFDLTIA